MNAPLSPAAMVCLAAELHDNGTHRLTAEQMRDLWTMLDRLPGDEAAIDGGDAELAGGPVWWPPAPAPAPILATIHGQAIMIHLHNADGEYHWSAIDDAGDLRGTGTDFHATPDDARADAVQVLEVMLSPDWFAAYNRAA